MSKNVYYILNFFSPFNSNKGLQIYEYYNITYYDPNIF